MTLSERADAGVGVAGLPADSGLPPALLKRWEGAQGDRNLYEGGYPKMLQAIERHCSKK